MGKIYLAADTCFWDDAAAQRQNLSVEGYNQMVIDSINKSINDEDTVILNGIISKGDLVQTKMVLDKIKGEKVIIDYRNQQQFTIANWRALGIKYVWDTPGAQDCEIMNKKSYIILAIDKDEIKQDLLNTNCYIAVPQSIYTTGEIYLNRVLNISLEKWNFEPIEIDERLPQIVDDKELFLSMKEEF